MELPKDVWLIVHREIHRYLLCLVNQQYKRSIKWDAYNTGEGPCYYFVHAGFIKAYNYRRLDNLSSMYVNPTIQSCKKYCPVDCLLPQRYVYSNGSGQIIRK